MAAQIVSIESDNGWRMDIHEKIDQILDQLEKEISQDKLDDISKALFEKRSDMLGAMTVSLIEKEYGHLLNQQYSDCPRCKKTLKARGELQKRTLETKNGKSDIYRPYFYCHGCKIGFYPLDEALGLSSCSKQYDVQDLEAWLASDMTFERAAETYERFTGETLSADHVHETAKRIAEDFGILEVCPSKEEIDKKIEQLSEGKTWRPVMMLAIDGAKEPTRP